MRHLYHILILLLFTTLCFSACQEHSLTPELERAEGLCLGAPNLAIDYLNEIRDKSTQWNDYQRHRYALLEAKALIYGPIGQIAG